MKIPVKECTLCGALIRDQADAIAKHRKFHQQTPQRPRINTHGRPPVLEEPSRRPPPLTAADGAISRAEQGYPPAGMDPRGTRGTGGWA